MIRTASTAAAAATAIALILTPNAALAAEVEETTVEEVIVEETVASEETAPAVEETAPEPEAVEETPVEVIEETPVVDDVAPEVVEEPTPETSEEVAPAAEDIVTLAAEPLVPTEGLIPLGITGVIERPGFPTIEHDRYLPQPRNAHISGLAKPETPTGTAPDEPVIDLRSLVGTRGGPNGDIAQTGFGFTADGALAFTPTHSAATGGAVAELLDWSEYTWRLSGIGSVGLMDTSNLDGKVTLVPFAENAEYGVRATLIHTATGVEAETIDITGYSGTNSGEFDWVGGAQRVFDGGIPMWEAWDRGAWRDNRYLSWLNPHEVISPSGASEIRSTTPAMAPGLRGEFTADFGLPGGFGLTRTGDMLQAGVAGTTPSHRIGQLHGEPVQRVVFDLADSVPGASAVALPDAPDGVLTLAASPAYERYSRFVGLDYTAPTGAVLTVSGTTVTVEFGSAEWVNSVGIWVPVEVDGAVEWAELRSETLPRDIAGGLVEKSIPTSTPLFITDEEMLEASRLTGLSPSLATVQAAELPEGVTRVDGGFEYVGSETPTELGFDFGISETVETEFGPVRPDSAGDGEVRITVVADAAPVDPEPEPQPEPESPEPQPEPEAPAPKPGAPKANPGANTGDAFAPASSEQNAAAVGLFGGLMAALGALLGFVVGRRKKASA